MKYYMYTRTTPPCPYCEGAKMLASTECVDHVIIDIGKDIDLQEFREQFPDQRTVPLILVDDGSGNRTKIGGYQEFKKYIEAQKATNGMSL
jgi:glutaredoxin